MAYTPFHEKFLEIAEKETKAITAINDPELPSGNYGLLESYCDEAGCDCRRVFFNVYSEGRNEIVAVIAYGWEDSKFYADWFGDNDPQIIEELKGPILNSASFQSKLAPILLDRVEKYVLKDEYYIERIKRHYRMFKDLIEKENRNKTSIKSDKKVKMKIGRNAPCPCGSGKKYKRCCMNKKA
ncbi:MAG: SEC-C metal-binding domain-containing protein [Euryarchaeota archaeon]|nr:SEC-C metal-binding domain-containing protein [Euryarchaeota archaeon]